MLGDGASKVVLIDGEPVFWFDSVDVEQSIMFEPQIIFEGRADQVEYIYTPSDPNARSHMLGQFKHFD